jgi:hypothetical protein
MNPIDSLIDCIPDHRIRAMEIIRKISVAEIHLDAPTTYPAETDALREHLSIAVRSLREAEIKTRILRDFLEGHINDLSQP